MPPSRSRCRESFNRVIDQFAAVQKAIGEVSTVAAGIGDIKRLFSNVKTRGGWARDPGALAAGRHPAARCLDRQSQGPAGQRRDGGIRHHHADARRRVARVLPIDAKFPIEDYERLIAASAAGDIEAERAALRSAGTPGARRGAQDRDQIHRPAGRRSNSRCFICRPTPCMPRSPAFLA